MIRFAFFTAALLGLGYILYLLALKLASKRRSTYRLRSDDGKVSETITEEIEE